jgi:predicted amidophosphoribosyltransferase
MVDLLLICAFCDQEMFIACPLCTRPLSGNHAHSVCVEHDTDIIDRHIARGYADPEVRLAPVVMVIKYEVMLLCFQSLTLFCFRLKEL